MFFGNSSLEMVYIEAIANALDAEATEININVSASAYNKPESITINISDNGVGFTDERYEKFSNLFDVDESSHKGLGRLVYLCYFDKVKITSCFEGTKKRVFDFTEDFNEEDAKVTTVDSTESGTTISMSGYALSRIRNYAFIQSPYLKQRLLEEFYSRLLQLKQLKKTIIIKIVSKVEGKEHTEVLSTADIPELEMVELESSITLIDKFYLYYSIMEVDPAETSFIAAVSVDNRTKRVDVLAEENFPIGNKIVFLLFSDWFRGKMDHARQNLTISEADMTNILTLFRKKVASVIEEKIPRIAERNKQTRDNLIERFPHLTGYFNKEAIGYIARADVLKKAQDQFFKASRELLDSTSLSDEQYEKSIELSARALTEYILFRQITIEQLKSSSKENSEAELHKLFASMKIKFDKTDTVQDIYRNNAWLLDDKYMTYEAVLSDREMGELVGLITGDESERDDDRPDIAFVFSHEPTGESPFDVVIVELKKRGITLEENMKVVTQLEKRARKLMAYYKNKIQRIWYYGVIEINNEVELALAGEYTELYSSGKMYYRETNVAISIDPKVVLPIGVFVWDIDAVIKDADARNSTFLKLIKSKISS